MSQPVNNREDFLLTSPDEVTLVKQTNYLKSVDVNVLPEDNNKFIQVIRPLLVELVGTASFLLVGLWGACSNSGVLTTGLCFGLALVVLAGSFGHISGGHFNPAVTVGILIAGEVQPVIAVLYVVMQILGGIAAGGLLRLLLPLQPYAACKGGATLLTTYLQANGTRDGTTLYEVADYVRIWQGILFEIIATFIFVTVVIMVALDTKSKTGLAPILIGFALGINIVAIGAFTGGSLNPARSLGPAIFSNHWTHQYVYWVGPLAGAIIAGLLYRTIWAHPDRRLFVKRPTNTVVTHVKQ